MTAGLQATVALTAGTLGLDVSMAASRGEVVAVLGPNGAGKTTLLRALAGLVPLDRGRIELDGSVLDDRETGEWVDPEDRAVGYVFQDYVLFPHLSAVDNVAFGLRARGMTKAAARAKAGEWLERVGLTGSVARSRPRALSGGQAQRVALARALVTSPRLLLLDEPLAALDASTRLELRRQLGSHLSAFDGVPLVVTHDPIEALALATRLVVIEEGRVVQSGTPDEVAGRPRSRYVADLVGLNLYRGVAAGSELSVDGGGHVSFAGALVGPAFATVHPRAVSLHRDTPAGSPRNVWRGRIADVSLEHDRVRVRVQASPPIVAEVTPAALAELRLGVGGDVWVAVKATEVQAYAA
jgi:molybdate transport system ATP-binding protein